MMDLQWKIVRGDTQIKEIYHAQSFDTPFCFDFEQFITRLNALRFARQKIFTINPFLTLTGPARPDGPYLGKQ